MRYLILSLFISVSHFIWEKFCRIGSVPWNTDAILKEVFNSSQESNTHLKFEGGKFMEDVIQERNVDHLEQCLLNFSLPHTHFI